MLNGRSVLSSKTSIEIDVVEHKGWEPKLYGALLHEWGQPGEHHADRHDRKLLSLRRTRH